MLNFVNIALKRKVLTNILGTKHHDPWCVSLSPPPKKKLKKNKRKLNINK